MGKPEDEQNLQSSELVAQGPNPGAGDCNWCCLFCSRVIKLVSCRCVFVLVLGVAVLLSAVFWLPFFHFGDQKDLDLDYGGLWVLCIIFFVFFEFSNLECPLFGSLNWGYCHYVVRVDLDLFFVVLLNIICGFGIWVLLGFILLLFFGFGCLV